MTNVVKTMLNSLYDLFSERFPSKLEAWDRYIEFIATDHNPNILHQLDHRFEWLLRDSELALKVRNVYEPKLLKTDHDDHLGEIYIRSCQQQDEAAHARLIPRHEALTLAAKLIGETQDKVMVFDPKVGSGRFIMAGHGLAPNAYFFGIDSDNRMVRITYTNMLIHNIKGYVLHADGDYHETDLSKKEGKHNWKYANKWQSHIDKLKPIVVTAQRELF